jgi:hypothetical protein
MDGAITTSLGSTTLRDLVEMTHDAEPAALRKSAG